MWYDNGSGHVDILYGVVSCITKNNRLIVNSHAGGAIIGQHSRPLRKSEEAGLGSVLRFTVFPPNRDPEGATNAYSLVNQYEVMDGSKCDLKITFFDKNDGKPARVNVSCPVTYSRTEGRFNVFYSEIIGDVFDVNGCIEEYPDPSHIYTVKTHHRQFYQPDKKDTLISGWSILYVEYWPTELCLKPVFGFFYYDTTLKAHAVYNTEAEDDSQRIIFVNTPILSRFDESNVGSWVDVYALAQTPNVAGRLQLLTGQTQRKHSDHNTVLVDLKCKFHGKRTSDGRPILNNSIMGEIIDRSGYYWESGLEQKMWCRVECDPRVHWIAVEPYDDRRPKALKITSPQPIHQGQGTANGVPSQQSSNNGRQSQSSSLLTLSPDHKTNYEKEAASLKLSSLTVSGADSAVSSSSICSSSATQMLEFKALVKQLLNIPSVRQEARTSNSDLYIQIMEAMNDIS